MYIKHYNVTHPDLVSLHWERKNLIFLPMKFFTFLRSR